MSSWYTFGKIGFYPNAAQDVYLIGTPTYPKVTIHLGNGKDLVIEAPKTSPEDMYIASVMWNGKPYKKSWFMHE
jgi:putative alpha-1,2-mannosidase